MLKDQSKFFDNLITNNLESYFNTEWNYSRQFVVHRILKNIKTSNIKTLLDIGCGCGYHDLLFAKALPDLTKIHGIDYSEESIKIANKLYPHPKIKRFQKDFNDIKNCFYDLIVSFQVIEHLENPTTLIKKAFSLLNHNGYCAICTPNYTRLSNRILKMIGRKPQLSDPMHFKEFVLEDLEILGCETGFTTYDSFGYGSSFTLPKINKNIIPYKLGTHMGSILPSISDVICIIFKKA